ncbi:MAG: S8 family serine peptidase [Candidatus Eisenbacteria bacterium]|nr:S8 family serine peptidase [Candidatus Eisenbacteria bacterium]
MKANPFLFCAPISAIVRIKNHLARRRSHRPLAISRLRLLPLLASPLLLFLAWPFSPPAFAASADLAITRLTAQKLVDDGEISITATVTNQGPEACGPCSLKVGANCPDNTSVCRVFGIAAMVANGQATRTATFPLWCDEAATYCTWADARFPNNSVDSDPDNSDNYASTNVVDVIFDPDRSRGFSMPIHNVYAQWETFQIQLAEPLPPGWSASVDPPMLSVPPNSVGSAMLSVVPPHLITQYPAIGLTSHCMSGDLPDAGFTYQTTAGTEMWSDAFDDCNISDWVVQTGSGGTIGVQSGIVYSPPCALRCISQTEGYACAFSPVYPFDQYCDYKISFHFRLQDTNNQDFTVIHNGHVSLMIGAATTLVAVTPSGMLPLGTLMPGRWYSIECAAYAHSTDYTVFLDGLPVGTVDYLSRDAEPRILLGDTGPGFAQRGAACWDDFVVTGIPLPPDVDVEICDWPRPARWWLGDHIYCDREVVEPGETATLYATIRNLGSAPATDVAVQMYASDPSLAQHAYDHMLHSIGVEQIAQVPPGDSVMVGPFFFTAPPGGNSFGENYWSYFVTVDAPDDPYTSGWPEEDNNVIVKAAWEKEATPGETERLSFWVTNPDATERKVVVDLDASGIPSGWSVQVMPPPGQEILLAPYARVPGFLELTADEEGGDVAFVQVSERILEPGGTLVRLGGGLGGTYALFRSLFVHYDGVPTQLDEDDLADLVGVDQIAYRCRYIPYICVRGVSYQLVDDILDLDGVLDTSPMYPVYHCLDVSARALKARSSATYPGTTAEDLGYDGTGINIAIIDTGVDDQHASLNGKFVAGFNTITDREENPDDDLPMIFHGTHCAGIAMGTGGAEQTYRGVAPGAELIDVKVLSALGRGTQDNVVQGIEWCIEHREEHSIRVLSMSLGSKVDSDGSDPECVAVDAAVDSGLVVVVAAGNEGPDNEGIGPPGSAANVITVASMCDSSTVVRDDDIISSFSSRGPRKDDFDGDDADEKKPEIAAPGGDGGDHQIMSARGIEGSQIGVGYHDMSGTSMACPHIAGVVALMLDADPTLTPAEVKEILLDTATDWGPAGWDTAFGYGYANAYEAVWRSIPRADPEICSWPRPEDFWTGPHIAISPITEMNMDYEATITVSNTGDFGAEPGSVTLLYGEPTSCLHAPDTEFLGVGTLPFPALAPGDSAAIGPFVFHSPANGNSFGQAYWSFLAMVNSSQDPLRSGWPEEDNNVACRNNWLVHNQAGEAREIHFWLRNPLSEPAHAKLVVDRDRVPYGWIVTTSPPEGGIVTLAPLSVIPATLVITPSNEEPGVIEVAEQLFTVRNRFLRVTGGLTVTMDAQGSLAPDEELAPLPARLCLAQNRPNPFGAATVLHFGLPSAGKVALQVYDVQGARVRRLLEGVLPAGYHDLLWDGRDQTGAPVGSGVYFCVLKAGDAREVRRMMVLR